EWVRAQNATTDGYLSKIPVRNSIVGRLTALTSEHHVGVPWREAGRLFYEMSEGSDKQPTLYMQNDVDSRPRAVMDPDEIWRSGSIEVRDFTVSPDGRWLAYAMAPGGADASETHVRELTSGRQLEDVVAGVLGTVCWTQDGGGFFYVAAARHDALTSSAGSRIEKKPAYHKLGQPQDRRIYEWTDNYRWAYIMLSEDGRRVLVVAERGSASELYTIDLGDPK